MKNGGYSLIPDLVKGLTQYSNRKNKRQTRTDPLRLQSRGAGRVGSCEEMFVQYLWLNEVLLPLFSTPQHHPDL